MKKNLCLAIFCLLPLAGCAHQHQQPMTGQIVQRQGDEIVVCGQLIHTGAPVVTWMDPGGYDAYRTERRFAPMAVSDWKDSQEQVKGLSTPNRFGLRKAGLTAQQIEEVRGGGWSLPMLQDKVDQFVLHFDVCGTSRQCFNILQDHRDLSVHFMLDLDGTIYQTLDLKERAWHATTANDQSIGIEIANIGAYRAGGRDNALRDWYRKQPDGTTRIIVPLALGSGKYERTPNFVGHPIRNDPVVGVIQGEELEMYDLTPQQYDSLIKLTATLCLTFPKIKCDVPRNPDGTVINHKLPKDQLDAYEGIMGHYHVQTDKTDPGPALQWDMLISGAKKLIAQAKARHVNEHWIEKPPVPDSYKAPTTRPAMASIAKSGT